jgi:hypothetical protein
MAARLISVQPGRVCGRSCLLLVDPHKGRVGQVSRHLAHPARRAFAQFKGHVDLALSLGQVDRLWATCWTLV